MMFLLRLHQYSKGVIGIGLVAAVMVLPLSVGVAAQDMEWAYSEDVAAFAKQMKDRDSTRRKRNLDSVTFQELDSKDSSAVLPLLVQALHDQDLGVRGRAARAISQLRGSVWPALLEYLKDQNQNVRLGVVAAITNMEAPTSVKIPVLMKALQDHDSGVRMQAVWGIGRLGPEAREAIPRLAEMARDSDVDMRVRVIYALQHIGWKLKEAVPPLGLALTDSEEMVRLKAARALVAVGPNAVVVLPAISDGLQVENPLFQSLLIEVLDTLGPDARPALPFLVNMLKSSRFDIRAATVKALKRIEGDGLPSLQEAALGNDSTLRLRALQVLLHQGVLGKNGLPTVKTVESELIGAFGPDTDHVLSSPIPLEEFKAQTRNNAEAICQYVHQLRSKKQLEFDYPNYDGPASFLSWIPWKSPLNQRSENGFFGMEVDIDNDKVQELLIKQWSWGMHGYRRVEYVNVVSGTDLSPYLMELRDVWELPISSTSGGDHPIRYDRLLTPQSIPGIHDAVSEYARINVFAYKETNYFLVDNEGEVIVGKYHSGGRMEVVCYLPQAKASKKKRS